MMREAANRINCEVCFRRCSIAEGDAGVCKARTCKNGKITAANYGRITSLALDPIEKKPLNRFFPGSRILSVGSYGCNLRCPFCQNHEISWSEQAFCFAQEADEIEPDQLARLAVRYRSRGNIGVAFTYNEPLIGYEFIKDTAALVHQAGMKNVIVTNGTAQLWVLDELKPFIDAMNIDLKGFTDHYYRDVLGGDLQMTLDFIRSAVQFCHVELTTLIVPGENDTENEMRDLASWVAGLKNKDGENIGRRIPLHISRFFPRFHMTDREPTDVGRICRLAEIAKEELEYVYIGNC